MMLMLEMQGGDDNKDEDEEQDEDEDDDDHDGEFAQAKPNLDTTLVDLERLGMLIDAGGFIVVARHNEPGLL